MNVWDYDQKTGKAVLVTSDLVLIKEFKDLLEVERNKCKEDPSGLNHVRADKEFTYIYLAIDWKSPYSGFSNQERHVAALKDADLSEDEFNDPTFRAACRKYVSLQDSNRYVRLLQASQQVTDKIIDYFENLDLNATDDQGKPLVKIADIQKAMDQSVKQIESLKQIEALVKKELTEQSQIRGGAVEGFMPDV